MQVNKPSVAEWNIYRTRFLVKAKQLSEPLVFIDSLGREHCGQAGDYLVEWSDGSRRIASQQIFEDVYVPMGPLAKSWDRSRRRSALTPALKSRSSSRSQAQA